jgi:HEPN domain-containing protein
MVASIGERQMTKTMKMTHRALALAGVLAVAACDQVGTGPAANDLTPEEQLELAVLEDQGSYDVPVELTSVDTDVAAAFGDRAAPEGRGLIDRARMKFLSARQALAIGNTRRALEEAREARRLLARAVMAIGGGDAVEALIERIEELGLTTTEDGDLFDDADAVGDEMNTLADEARDLLARGDSVGAAERALLGEQRARFRRRDVAPERARLAVALAETAVSLAERLIASQDAPTPVRAAVTDVATAQNRWLMHAQRMLEHAQQALANGRYARAVHFAQHAHWSALKAVILPGGVTEEELKAMVDLADNLYAEAEASLPDEPTELQKLMFQRAGRLIELGKTKLEEGNKRGVAALWRASVICAWLIT